MIVPEGLSWWRARPGGAEWLDALPRLATDCAERWDLRLGDPFEPATISLVVPAERGDGTRAVLKITFPVRDPHALDRERIRGWAVVHAVAWGGETGTDWDRPWSPARAGSPTPKGAAGRCAWP